MNSLKDIKQTLITNFFKIKKKTTQTLITEYFEPVKVFGYNEKTGSWHCLQCGTDMGPQNPRQLCGKTYCQNLFY